MSGRRFARGLLAILDRWFLSTPPALRGRAVAAASLDSCSRDGVGKPVSGAGHQTPEGEELVTPSPSGPPSCETDLFWEPDPANRFEFADDRMATVVDRWEGETS